MQKAKNAKGGQAASAPNGGQSAAAKQAMKAKAIGGETGGNPKEVRANHMRDADLVIQAKTMFADGKRYFLGKGNV